LVLACRHWALPGVRRLAGIRQQRLSQRRRRGLAEDGDRRPARHYTLQYQRADPVEPARYHAEPVAERAERRRIPAAGPAVLPSSASGGKTAWALASLAVILGTPAIGCGRRRAPPADTGAALPDTDAVSRVTAE